MANGALSPRDQWKTLLPAIRDGVFEPRIGRVYTLEEAMHAVASLDERRATGKVIVRVR
jgi:NADPH2:quinone reductase